MSALDRISVAALGNSVAELESETKLAERAGIECTWAPELFRSSVTQAAYLAARTERIGVATGIAWAFTRSPFILAVTALDVDEMSGGRFRLGLGAGVKRLNETWHNADYGKPAPHLREAIEATRADHAGGRGGGADPLRGHLLRHRHQGMDPAPSGPARVGADLHRGCAVGDVADGRRRG